LEVALRLRLYTYIRSKAPGLLEVLDLLCSKLYGSKALDLLLTNPSKLYSALLTYYGNSGGADYAALLLFLNPLAECFGSYEVVRELLDAMKVGNDRRFLELVTMCRELTAPRAA
jgi:hypothetical protein